MEFEFLPSIEALPWDWMEQHRGNNLFLSRTYMQAWVRYHLRDARLQVVASSDNGSTKAIFPLVVSSQRFLGKRLKIWQPVGWNTAWYPHPFVPVSPDTVSRFFSFLKYATADWDAVIIPCVNDFITEVTERAADFGLPTFLRNSQVLPFLSVDRSWEEYRRGLSKKFRGDIRRQLSKCEKAGRYAYGKADHEQACQNLIETFIGMHENRWESKGQQSRYATIERHRNFLQHMTAALRREGKLFLRYLSLDGAIIAIAICMCEGKKIYYFLPTFDVQYHELTPGKVLLYHILGEAFEMGCDEVDLGPGTHDYKWSWTKDKRTVHYVVVFRGDWHVWLKDSALPQLRRQGKLMMKRFFPGWVQS